MKPPKLSLEQIQAIGAPCYRITIPDSYKDANGHMNIRWYMVIFDDAGDVLHDEMGLTLDYHREHGTGTFDLEHHIQYLSEVMPGEQVAVYLRYVALSAKRLLYMMFLVNETRGKLSATFECLNAFADLKVRKMAPWPGHAAAIASEKVKQSEALAWPAPVSGAIQA